MKSINPRRRRAAHSTGAYSHTILRRRHAEVHAVELFANTGACLSCAIADELLGNAQVLPRRRMMAVLLRRRHHPLLAVLISSWSCR